MKFSTKIDHKYTYKYCMMNSSVCQELQTQYLSMKFEFEYQCVVLISTLGNHAVKYVTILHKSKPIILLALRHR